MPLEWTELQALDDFDLALVVQAAVDVLRDHDGQVGRVEEMPPRVLRREASSSLGVDEGAVDRATIDARRSRAVALSLLADLAREPTLAAEIESAYDVRKRMMFVDPGTIAAFALLLLVLKLRRIRIGKGQTDIEFYEVRPETLAEVGEIVGR